MTVEDDTGFRAIFRLQLKGTFAASDSYLQLEELSEGELEEPGVMVIIRGDSDEVPQKVAFTLIELRKLASALTVFLNHNAFDRAGHCGG